jgi:hypothetical protein
MLAPGGEQRRFVGEVRQVGADHARRAGRQCVEVNRLRERDRAGVNLKDLLPPAAIGWLHCHPAVKATGAQQRRVEDLGTVGGGEHDDRLDTLKAVHLGQDLIERLLTLVVATGDRNRPLSRATDRVKLVDEDDRRCRLLGLREQVTHPRCAHPDDRLDELRGRDREERCVRLAGHRASQQRLTRPRRARQQHPVRHPSTQPAVSCGVTQKVHDFGQLRLRLIDPRDVRERDPDRRRIDPPRLRATKITQSTRRSPPRGPSREHDEQTDEQQRRPEPQQQRAHQRAARGRRGGVDLNSMSLQQPGQLVVVPERRDLGTKKCGRRRLTVLGRVAHRDLERALDRVAFRSDRRDAIRPHRAHEIRAKRDIHPRLPGGAGQQDRTEVEDQ